MRYFILIAIFFSVSSWAVNKQVSDALMSPTLLLNQNRYAQAANTFHVQTNRMLTLESQLGAKKMWQAAGLAEVLAASSAEKNGDPIAYEYWANSVRYFLMGGSSWQQMQSQLHQQFEQANTQLNVNMTQGGVGANVDNDWLQLLSLLEVWDNKLGFFSYQSPSSELASKVVQPQLAPQNSTQPTRSGEQLKQYQPTKKLQITSGFRHTQTFTPQVVPENSENKREETLGKNIKHIDSTVISEPISLVEDIDAQETDVNQTSSTPITRGNLLGARSAQGVEATQRRSFAPIQDEN
ncbi:hypothetical protein DZ860_10650 [Vibrio sinensis]|uniref:Uncharacterized protein n=1 Tax=Vibrio sinensis TaxID=2302434 RepID=A0A3A6QJP4_9VIBR|nr:hypothetical protein [Vibrio sinensis]RJX71395.1 hypothetical protein DZ860_10650 [Vibrio sinensis]